MPRPTWMTVPSTSRSDAPFSVVAGLLARSGTTAHATYLHSVSGRTVVVLSLDEIGGLVGFEIRMDVAKPGTTRVALLLTDTDAGTRTDELRDLTQSADLVALPRSLASGSLQGFTSRGQIVQQARTLLPETFEVVERSEVLAELLTRDAPVDVGEGPDNLTERERWFKQRHGRDPRTS